MGSRTQLTESVAPASFWAVPSARELRAQAIQRLQVGVFGLALMLLLVGLANIIMDHAKANEAALASSSKAAMSSSGAGAGNTDPLADISVVPTPDPVGKAQPAVHPAPAAQ
ncbi:MAG: hypothetical protein KGH96_08255 [Sphingomonadales bacterium]|nr:hypothetical protein [Sphingomonadales bacterium]